MFVCFEHQTCWDWRGTKERRKKQRNEGNTQIRGVTQTRIQTIHIEHELRKNTLFGTQHRPTTPHAQRERSVVVTPVRAPMPIHFLYSRLVLDCHSETLGQHNFDWCRIPLESLEWFQRKCWGCLVSWGHCRVSLVVMSSHCAPLCCFFACVSFFKLSRLKVSFHGCFTFFYSHFMLASLHPEATHLPPNCSQHGIRQ